MSGGNNIKFPISAKIILLFIILFLIAILAISIANFINSKSILEDRILCDLTALAKSKAEQISSVVEQDVDSTRLIASRRRLVNYLTDIASQGLAAGKYRTEIIAELKEAGDFSASVRKLEVIDLKGHVLASTVPEDVGKDVSASSFFMKAQEGLDVGDFYMDAGKLMYSISLPIRTLDEKDIIGMVKADFEVARIIQILSDYTGLGGTGEVYLGKRVGSDIVFLNPLRHKERAMIRMEIPKEAQFLEPMKFATDRNIGIATTRDYRGVDVLASYQYISIGDWGLVAKIDSDEAFGPIRNLLAQTIFIGIVVLILGILVVFTFTTMILAPLKKLHKGTDVIAGGNLDYHVDVKTDDEIGELAASFNHMTESLKKITASRDELNREIESRKRTELELKEAMMAKTKFVAMVSHELRTPLAAIKEGINIVLDGSAGATNKEQRQFLDIASRNVDRLARLINDILDFQKLESGKVTFNFQENDINEVIEEVYHLMKPLTEERGLYLKIDLDKSLPKVKFDRDRIIQVCNNFMHNAVKFTREGGIAISTARRDDYIQVSVKDTGPGIASQDMPRLFRSFEQLGPIETGKGGAGLGLSISKEIMDRHKGKIWMTSEVGKGTTFYFALPIVA